MTGYYRKLIVLSLPVVLHDLMSPSPQFRAFGNANLTILCELAEEIGMTQRELASLCLMTQAGA
jgi:hypothetical protein